MTYDLKNEEDNEADNHKQTTGICDAPPTPSQQLLLSGDAQTGAKLPETPVEREGARIVRDKVGADQTIVPEIGLAFDRGNAGVRAWRGCPRWAVRLSARSVE